MADIKLGDVVRLKSGSGPDMTVDEIGNNKATCLWFSDKNEPKKAYFSLHTLVKVEDDDGSFEPDVV
jgi:uncharacterized protein YodC (DUF2158 family)